MKGPSRKHSLIYAHPFRNIAAPCIPLHVLIVIGAIGLVVELNNWEVRGYHRDRNREHPIRL